MEDMGSLQPGLPSPTMLPENWEILIIDLKDCFFSIPLHPQDAEKFAFSVPSINKSEPAKRYHWIVLPQGMKNSPTICQHFVAWALNPFRQKFPQLIVYHYMDDILICGEQLNKDEILRCLKLDLESQGLQIAPEKVQKSSPWKYLGWVISHSAIQPQKLKISTEIKTLNDVQKLVGDIQWVRNISGITNDDLKPLVQLLGTSTKTNEARTLGPVQEKALRIIMDKICNNHAQRIVLTLPVTLMIINSDSQRLYPFAIITQWDNTASANLRILEWIFSPITPRKTIVTKPEILSQLIMKGRNRIIDITGREPYRIILPLVQEYLEWLLRVSLPFQTALTQYDGEISNIYPPYKLLPLLHNQHFETFPKQSETPVTGITVFTDAGKRSRLAACVWQHEQQWQKHLISGTPDDSLQTLELQAVIWAFENWNNSPLNVVSDSLYVVGIIHRIEGSILKEIKNNWLYSLLLKLLRLLQIRTHSYFITHIRSHQFTHGLSIGNNQADLLVSPAWAGPPVNSFAQARESHSFFHQSAKMLARQFAIPVTDAQGIVKSCPSCQKIGFGLGLGVNPRGLQPLQLWQMDVTHFSEFGRQKFIHVCIDTFSMALWATAQTEGTAKHVRRHLYMCFAVLEVPKSIKTDNGPAYVSRSMAHFYSIWGIKHITGIAHSPTGQ
uniref:Uncharacterized protein n=1 Tax=Amazona collaria TaxID=241587 RepID=A0A8B9J0K1_9PSIT